MHSAILAIFFNGPWSIPACEFKCLAWEVQIDLVNRAGLELGEIAIARRVRGQYGVCLE